MSTRAVIADALPLPDARTSEELLAAGLDARFFGTDVDDEGADVAGDDDATIEVEGDVFVRWLERSEFVLGGVVARWWVGLAVPDEEPPDNVLAKDSSEETVSALHGELCRLVGGKLTVRLLLRGLLRAGALTLADGEDVAEARRILCSLEEEGAARSAAKALRKAVKKRSTRAITAVRDT